MTLITLQDGKLVLRDGKIGTEQACCCGCCPPGESCCGRYEYQIDYCVQVDGEWVQDNFPNPGDPCECCNGFTSTILFEGFDPAVGGNIRIIECLRRWCGEAESGIPDYCCCDDLTPEQSAFCGEWWLRLSDQSPSDLVDPDAVCASAYEATAVQIGCHNPLP